MWYLEIMLGLLEKLPNEKRTDGELFLKELFLCIKKVDENPEIEFYLGLIDKSFLKFGHKKPHSVTLTEFSRYLLGLSVLYIKSSNEFDVWNSDFVTVLEKIRQFLDIDKEIKRKFLIKLLNHFERNTLASLDHKVDINFKRLNYLFKNHCTLKAAELFIDACMMLDENTVTNSSHGFNMLIQNTMERIILNNFLTIADTNDTSGNSENDPLQKGTSDNHRLNDASKYDRLSLFKSTTDSCVESSKEDSSFSAGTL